MKTKKGASELIAYVLLIGFTIALAAVVTNWVIDQTKKFDPASVAGGSKTYCEDVVLEIENLEKTSMNSDASCSDIFIGIITLKNKGKFTVWNAKALGAGVSGFTFPSGLISDGLAPGDISSDTTQITTKQISISFCREDSGNYIEIIPQIEIEDKKFYCGQTSAIINDNILTQFGY